MAFDPKAVFDEHLGIAKELLETTANDLSNAYGALGNIDYSYSPVSLVLGWTPPSPPGLGTGITTAAPVLGQIPVQPILSDKFYEIPNFVGSLNASAPTFQSRVTLPSGPGNPPGLSTQEPSIPSIGALPSQPSMLPLPSTTLPYSVISIPPAPVLDLPVFDGIRPGPLQLLTIDEVLERLDTTYYEYRDVFMGYVQDHSTIWLRAVLADRGLIASVETVLQAYVDPVNGGGTGIPVKIEEAIAGRAHDRTQGEYIRAEKQVWEGVSKRGLYLASGALMGGLQQARYAAADANAKVYTDVATKNFELEQQNMQFMLKLSESLESKLLDIGVEYAKVTLAVHGQAVDLMKTVVTTMVEIYNAIVRAWTAEWEGYKAAVEVYRARIGALEMQVKLYDSQIRAELAKTEVNKAYVSVMEVISNVNKTLVELYKAQIEAALAPVEVGKAQAQVYEAIVRGYAARVEAYVAQWRGVTSAAEAMGAEARAYAAQVEGYTGQVNAFRARVDSYAAQVNGAATANRATTDINRGKLETYSTELDAVIKTYTAQLAGVAEEWKVAAEQAKVQVAYWTTLATSNQAAYAVNVQTQMEMAKTHYGVWLNQIEKMQNQAKVVEDIARVSAGVASSALNGLTSFAGQLAQEST